MLRTSALCKYRRILNGVRRLLCFGGSNHTVFALSSGHGKAGVAVVRVSGPQSSKVLKSIGRFKTLPNPRSAVFKKLKDPDSDHMIDHGLVLWFPGPNSFTGEDCVEFHIHGGMAVTSALLESIGKLPGLKPAEAGDFTKRAFMNGKFDLTEVEGLADLIHAETEFQRKQALRQMELFSQNEDFQEKVFNHLSEFTSEISSDGRLEQTISELEQGITQTNIDFGEEENIEDHVITDVKNKVDSLITEVKNHLADGRKGERLRNGINVAIVGAPNVGKSTLLNILCQKPAAIVSKYAGTTRDVVESALDLYGFPVILSIGSESIPVQQNDILLADTAGLREGSHPVEEEGIRRAIKRGGEADLKILVASCNSLKSYISHPVRLQDSLSEFVKAALEDSFCNNSFAESFKSTDTIIVMNKTDLFIPNNCFTSFQGTPVCWVSCKTLDGMESFFQMLKKQLNHLGGDPSIGSPRLTQVRHRYHLEHCVTALTDFKNNVSDESSLVEAAEYLRAALKQVGQITGKVGVEDVLDVVFRDFCIGK